MRHQPDVVVCDIGLPGLDGYEVARRLREVPHLRSSLLIAVSGYGESADRDKARAAGFSHYVTKPADAAALADLIANNGKSESDSRPAPVTKPIPQTG
jgi:CheY-like chemotaxis protein